MNEQQQEPSTNGVMSHTQAAPAESLLDRRFGELSSRPLAPEQQRAANRSTLAIVLTIMSSMALLGLLFALWTVPIRRANDTKALEKSGRPPIYKSIEKQ